MFKGKQLVIDIQQNELLHKIYDVVKKEKGKISLYFPASVRSSRFNNIKNDEVTTILVTDKQESEEIDTAKEKKIPVLPPEKIESFCLSKQSFEQYLISLENKTKGINNEQNFEVENGGTKNKIETEVWWCSKLTNNQSFMGSFSRSCDNKWREYIEAVPQLTDYYLRQVVKTDSWIEVVNTGFYFHTLEIENETNKIDQSKTYRIIQGIFTEKLDTSKRLEFNSNTLDEIISVYTENAELMNSIYKKIDLPDCFNSIEKLSLSKAIQLSCDQRIRSSKTILSPVVENLLFFVLNGIKEHFKENYSICSIFPEKNYCFNSNATPMREVISTDGFDLEIFDFERLLKSENLLDEIICLKSINDEKSGKQIKILENQLFSLIPKPNSLKSQTFSGSEYLQLKSNTHKFIQYLKLLERMKENFKFFQITKKIEYFYFGLGSTIHSLPRSGSYFKRMKDFILSQSTTARTTENPISPVKMSSKTLKVKVLNIFSIDKMQAVLRSGKNTEKMFLFHPVNNNEDLPFYLSNSAENPFLYNQQMADFDLNLHFEGKDAEKLIFFTANFADAIEFCEKAVTEDGKVNKSKFMAIYEVNLGKTQEIKEFNARHCIQQQTQSLFVHLPDGKPFYFIFSQQKIEMKYLIEFKSVNKFKKKKYKLQKQAKNAGTQETANYQRSKLFANFLAKFLMGNIKLFPERYANAEKKLEHIVKRYRIEKITPEPARYRLKAFNSSNYLVKDQFKLEETQWRGVLVDLIGEIHLIQKYKNTYRDKIDKIQYILPLPENTRLLNFCLYFDSKRIYSRVFCRESDVSCYQPLLFRSNPSSSVQLSYLQNEWVVTIDHPPSFSSITLHASYSCELLMENNSALLYLPTSLSTGASNPERENLAVELVLETGGIDIQAIESISEHTIEVKSSARLKTVKWNQASNAKFLNEDFLVKIKFAPNQAPRLWIEQHPTLGSCAMMLVLPSNSSLNTKPVTSTKKQNIQIVCDRSNSMKEGNAFQLCKKLIVETLGSLHSLARDGEDTLLVNLYTFGNVSQSVYCGNTILGSEVYLELLQIVDELSFDCGSSNIIEVLSSMYAMTPLSAGETANIFLFTDGRFSDIDSICKLVQHHSHKFRLFIFAVGNNVNVPACTLLARHGRGSVEFIISESAVLHPSYTISSKIGRQIRKSMSECLYMPHTEGSARNDHPIGHLSTLFNSQSNIIYLYGHKDDPLVESLTLSWSTPNSGYIPDTNTERFTTTSQFMFSSSFFRRTGDAIHRRTVGWLVDRWEFGFPVCHTNAIYSQMQEDLFAMQLLCMEHDVHSSVAPLVLAESYEECDSFTHFESLLLSKSLEKLTSVPFPSEFLDRSNKRKTLPDNVNDSEFIAKKPKLTIPTERERRSPSPAECSRSRSRSPHSSYSHPSRFSRNSRDRSRSPLGPRPSNNFNGSRRRSRSPYSTPTRYWPRSVSPPARPLRRSPSPSRSPHSSDWDSMSAPRYDRCNRSSFLRRSPRRSPSRHSRSPRSRSPRRSLSPRRGRSPSHNHRIRTPHFSFSRSSSRSASRSPPRYVRRRSRSPRRSVSPSYNTTCRDESCSRSPHRDSLYRGRSRSRSPRYDKSSGYRSGSTSRSPRALRSISPVQSSYRPPRNYFPYDRNSWSRSPRRARSRSCHGNRRSLSPNSPIPSTPSPSPPRNEHVYLERDYLITHQGHTLHKVFQANAMIAKQNNIIEDLLELQSEKGYWCDRMALDALETKYGIYYDSRSNALQRVYSMRSKDFSSCQSYEKLTSTAIALQLAERKLNTEFHPLPYLLSRRWTEAKRIAEAWLDRKTNVKKQNK